MTGVVYDRQYDDGNLTFEASGALKDAALVMRDRETDSWWSVMEGKAIQGPMDGQRLKETGLAVKTTWGEWRAEHPDTRVLSVNGKTHEPENVYADYFATDRTFRDADPKDDRLRPKTPIFAFRWKDQPYAVTHAGARGGVLWWPEGHENAEPVVFIHRRPDAPIGVSTVAGILPKEIVSEAGPEGLAESLDGHLVTRVAGAERLPGFDTYWYTWIAQNPGTILIIR